MSSSNCVVPVDWDVLWGRVVPGWMDVLAGGRTVRQFYGEFMPLADEYQEYIQFDEPFRAPGSYLSLFPRASDGLVRANDVACSPAYAEFEKAVDTWQATFLVCLAIKHTAAVDLPGTDAFADDCWLAHLTKPPIQVAGTKNSFDFLEALFESEWRQQEHRYRHSRKPGCDAAVQELLESLFLYVRAFPGTCIHVPSSSWPATNEDSIAGFLNPAEVRALSYVVNDWPLTEESSVVPALFRDRVVRAAENKLGLITLYDALV